MQKSKAIGWPWNNRPSKRHVWTLKRMSGRTGAVEHCARCGSVFIERADTRGPVYCHPSPEWMQNNSADDGKQG
jgi:hypothetical protein